MGNLKSLYFTGDLHCSKKGKLINGSIIPLDITHEQVMDAYSLSDNSVISRGQLSDNSVIRASDKETLQLAKTLGLQDDSDTGEIYYGTTVIRKKVTRDNVYSINTIDKENSSAAYCDSKSLPGITKRPEDQTDDEWYVDFDEAYFLEHGYYL